jgi:hypothetical protein
VESAVFYFFDNVINCLKTTERLNSGAYSAYFMAGNLDNKTEIERNILP